MNILRDILVKTDRKRGYNPRAFCLLVGAHPPPQSD
jgi:hypothetical protein